jgi:MFS family permease
VPSNLALDRFGARRWIARIMISWGLISACTMLVSSAASFYAVRFLLGMAEAGFFPGMILYLSYWSSTRSCPTGPRRRAGWRRRSASGWRRAWRERTACARSARCARSCATAAC